MNAKGLNMMIGHFRSSTLMNKLQKASIFDCWVELFGTPEEGITNPRADFRDGAGIDAVYELFPFCILATNPKVDATSCRGQGEGNKNKKYD